MKDYFRDHDLGVGHLPSGWPINMPSSSQAMGVCKDIETANTMQDVEAKFKRVEDIQSFIERWAIMIRTTQTTLDGKCNMRIAYSCFVTTYQRHH